MPTALHITSLESKRTDLLPPNNSDYFCPEVFKPTGKEEIQLEEKTMGAENTYEFKSHHAQHGCCLLDKVLGIMEMLYVGRTVQSNDQSCVVRWMYHQLQIVV